MKAAIVGVGLIGGSFALTLKDNGICDEVIGVDNSERNRAKALELGLVDRTASPRLSPGPIWWCWLRR